MPIYDQFRAYSENDEIATDVAIEQIANVLRSMSKITTDFDTRPDVQRGVMSWLESTAQELARQTGESSSSSWGKVLSWANELKHSFGITSPLE